MYASHSSGSCSKHLAAVKHKFEVLVNINFMQLCTSTPPYTYAGKLKFL